MRSVVWSKKGHGKSRPFFVTQKAPTKKTKGTLRYDSLSKLVSSQKEKI